MADRVEASDLLASAEADGAAGSGTAHAMPRWVGYILVAFGVAILLAFAATTNVRQLAEALRGIRPGLLGIAAVAVMLQILIKAIRWQYMIRRLTGTEISTRFAAVSIVAGVAAGAMAPARSFEMAKAMLLRGSYGTNLRVSTSAMIVERVLDFVLVIVALMLATLWLPRRIAAAGSVIPVLILAFVAACALATAAPLRVRSWMAAVLNVVPAPAGGRTLVRRLIDTLFESILLWRQARTLGALLVMTSLSTVLDLTRVCAVFWGMGVALPAPILVFTYLGAAVLGMALLIPGGVGVTEVSQAGLIALLAPAAAPAALIRSGVLADRSLSYYLLMVVGAGFLIAYHRYRRIFR